MNGRTNLVVASAAAVAAWVAVAACAAPADSTKTPGAQADDIVAGTPATAYPEAVLVDLYSGGTLQAMCSGALVGPKLVLTAGHCVYGFSSWRITAPNAGGKTAKASHGETYDWTASGESVDPSMHDIGLVELDTPIQLDTYPALADAPLASNKSVVNVGRIQDGTLSNTQLFVSKSIKVTAGDAYGFPYDYRAAEVIEPGDSGGPDLLPGAAPHTIVAVNSGAGSSDEVLARVDLVKAWIESHLAGASGSGGSSGGSTKPSTPPPASSCAHDPCARGARLKKSCDPCATSVCTEDSYCCAHTWDDTCVGEAFELCSDRCSGAPPAGSCGSVDDAGACKDGQLVYCDGGSLTRVDCGAYGLACKVDDGSGEYDCL